MSADCSVCAGSRTDPDVPFMACPSCGPRRWVLDLGMPRPPMTTNEARRAHWSKQRAAKALVQDTVWLTASLNKVPFIERCSVEIVWHAPDRRRRDPDCLGLMLKAALDGLVGSGVIEDDHAGIVSRTSCRIVTADPPARIELVITEEGPGE